MYQIFSARAFSAHDYYFSFVLRARAKSNIRERVILERFQMTA